MTKVWNDDETDGEFFCRRQWSIYYGELGHGLADFSK